MIPYIIMLLLCGLPLLFMELSMGQYTRRGPIGAIGKMCPIFQVDPTFQYAYLSF